MTEIFAAAGVVLQPIALLNLFIGSILGIIVGAIPGLTSSMLIALTLPLTFTMKSEAALILLVAMYVGGITGGLISATLLRIPGTPASVMTVFDGYPMARSGRPGRALALGIGASFFGGVVSWFFLVTLSAPMARFALRFGPFEYFSLILLALVLISSVTEGRFIKGLISGFFGLLVAMPGVDATTGQMRLTFGFNAMAAGFELLAVLVGLFAVGQILSDVLTIDRPFKRLEVDTAGIVMRLSDYARHWVNLVRSSIIGTVVGILPGVGGNVASIIAYTTTKNLSKTPEEFGKGSEAGIVAAESANNASVGGALIPLIAMGIPGSIVDVFLLAALIIHDVQPGPFLFIHNPDLVRAIMATCLIATILVCVIMTGTVRWVAVIMAVSRAHLFPALLVFCVVGTYAVNNSVFDVWVMLGFGLVGFAFDRLNVPYGPFTIGVVLGPLAERHLRSGLMGSGGSWEPFITRPLSLTFLVVSILLFFWPLVREYLRGRTGSQLP